MRVKLMSWFLQGLIRFLTGSASAAANLPDPVDACARPHVFFHCVR